MFDHPSELYDENDLYDNFCKSVSQLSQAAAGLCLTHLLLAPGAVSRHWQWHGSFLEMGSAFDNGSFEFVDT